MAEPGEDESDKGSDKIPGKASSAISAVTGAEFPIDGESKWPTVMRIMAFATLLCLLVIGGVFKYLTGADSFVETQQLGFMLGGIVFLVIVQYFILLVVVIPRQANYGRFIIHRDKVEFYPLTALGLDTSGKAKIVPMHKFLGVATGRVAEKKGRFSYGVYLVHGTEKGHTINIRRFDALGDAEQYAMRLGDLIRLPAVSGVRRGAKQ